MAMILSEKLKEPDFLYQLEAYKVPFHRGAREVMAVQGLKRRVVYVSLYEAIAIAVCAVAFSVLTGHSVAYASVLSAAASAVAVVWNVSFNSLFEAWEARQRVRGRSLRRRVAHAIGFEGGLIIFLVPLIAWWLDVSLWQAFVMDLGLVVFFLVYTFVFNWGFDLVFGLPASALHPVPVSAIDASQGQVEPCR